MSVELPPGSAALLKALGDLLGGSRTIVSLETPEDLIRYMKRGDILPISRDRVVQIIERLSRPSDQPEPPEGVGIAEDGEWLMGIPIRTNPDIPSAEGLRLGSVNDWMPPHASQKQINAAARSFHKFLTEIRGLTPLAANHFQKWFIEGREEGDGYGYRLQELLQSWAHWLEGKQGTK